MIRDQDKRAVENMARCGLDIDGLCASFPQIPKEDILAIYEYICNIKFDDEYEDKGVSINCS